jgi:hypothetical protein
MKYEIKLLTQRGPVKEIYTDTQDLKEFENEMIKKHGEFIMLSSNPIQ